MSKKTVLTGITTTGTPHIGNYLGAIKPAIEASENPAFNSYFFLADFHALIKCQEPERVARSTREIAATWLALGLDTDKATFYRQTDIPEITELTWILTCQTSKGLMNRAHAYKAAVDANREAGKEDLDDGVTMGLFNYPILMAADILMFNADIIPVGKDQIQHIEMARDIAGRFNHNFEPLFTLPEAQVDEETQLIPGLDGRKMSKSYNNTIPLFCSSDELRKLINQIVTDTREPGEPKDPDNTLMHLYRCFASETESAAMRQRFIEGIGWGDAKKELFEFIDAQLTAPRARYNELMNDMGAVEAILDKGAERAREYSAPFLDKVRHAVGIRRLTDTSASQQKADVKEKEKSAEEIARAEEGRRRAILMQIRPLLDQVEQADDKAAAAQALVAQKTAEVESLKKKARQKAQNELDLLTEELAALL
ncbi:tryptophan--tRNA ligase [Marinobacterium sediminicola]|uniref:Tryptophan--tRNA ligase n=1 Tax=Marinobacterium sediminicola TaxID=518898 RepID=A0ABY1RWM0_9GAMM|nr:tryptophan--tRNA ligase [Marinobacterium sediminicola]ULG70253.1 tryptophan--tRNA ligase [Marinobacterium sediminicola]SMR69934.1 tryptophanyl-tRNA synthetase [Marinobacterium sediminicola]